MNIKSIRLRIMISMTLMLIIVFFSLGFVVTQKTKTIVIEREEMEVANFSYEYGEVISKRLERALNTTKSLASSIEGLVDKGEVDRADLDAIQVSILEDDSNINAIWISGELNEIDGRDAELAGQVGELNSGRYVTFYAKDKDKVIDVQLSPDYTPGDYFAVMKKDRKATIRNPYLDNVDGRKVLVTSVIYPMEIGNKFIGTAGIDMSLESFQHSVTEIVNGRENIKIELIAYDGQYVATSDEALMGSSIDEETMTLLTTNINEAGAYKDVIDSDYFGEKVNRSVTALYIEEIENPWLLVVETPVSNITSEVRAMRLSIVSFMCLGLLGILISLFFIMRTIKLPLISTVDYLKVFATGDFTATLQRDC